MGWVYVIMILLSIVLLVAVVGFNLRSLYKKGAKIELALKYNDRRRRILNYKDLRRERIRNKMRRILERPTFRKRRLQQEKDVAKWKAQSALGKKSY